MAGHGRALRRLSHVYGVLAVTAAEEEAQAEETALVESPLAKLRDATAEADYVVSEHLPGPLQDKDREEVLKEIQAAGGQSHVQWMQWQEQ